MSERLARFTIDRDGGHATADSKEGLQPGFQVVINGSTDLSSAITGNSGACVESIKLVKLAQVDQALWEFQVQVVGRGPKGIDSGWFNLGFTDQTGDTYNLGLWRSESETHLVSYNSNKPNIMDVSWGSDMESSKEKKR